MRDTQKIHGGFYNVPELFLTLLKMIAWGDELCTYDTLQSTDTHSYVLRSEVRKRSRGGRAQAKFRHPRSIPYYCTDTYGAALIYDMYCGI